MGCVTGLLGLPAELYPHRTLFNWVLSNQLLYYNTPSENVKNFFTKFQKIFLRKERRNFAEKAVPFFGVVEYNDFNDQRGGR